MHSPLEDIIAVGILIFGMACVAMIISGIKNAIYVIKKATRNRGGFLRRNFSKAKEDSDYLEYFTVDGKPREEVFSAISNTHHYEEREK